MANPLPPLMTDQASSDACEATAAAAMLQRVTHAAQSLMPAAAALLSLRMNGAEQVAAASGVAAHPAAPRIVSEALSEWNDDEAAAATSPSPIIISDIRRDRGSRVAEAMRDAGLIALAVVPLVTPEGTRIGALAVADSVPRRWSASDVEAIQDLAAVAAAAIGAADGTDSQPPANDREIEEIFARLPRLEQQLRETAQRLSFIELATQDVLWDWDTVSGRLLWNDAIARRFRYTLDEIRETTDWHIERIHPGDRERVLRSIERALHGTETSWSDEYRFLRGDETYAAVLDRAHLVRNERGEVVRVIGAILDISELRATEEAQRLLAHASTALESALEVDTTARTLARVAIPELADVCTVDLLRADGSLHRFAVAHVDPQLEQFLGLGDDLTHRSEMECASAKAVRTGNTEFGAAANGGSLHTLGIAPEAGITAYVVVPITARGKVLGVATFAMTHGHRRFTTLDILTAKDLARRAGMALDNAILYETVRSAVRVRNDVLGMVSHDLRVPVSVMNTAVAMLKEHVPGGDPQVDQLFTVLERATIQMNSLVEDLLDASRLESDQFKLENAPLDLERVISEACAMLGVLAAAKEISIETMIDAAIPTIRGDAPKITRVIANLIGNAIKFSPRGSCIHVHGGMQEGELQVTVRDEGDGIPSDQLARVFDRFWTGHPAQERGAGLGLAIARGIIEEHGGRIWATSETGVGSTFTFSLPAVQERNPRAAHGNGGRF